MTEDGETSETNLWSCYVSEVCFTSHVCEVKTKMLCNLLLLLCVSLSVYAGCKLRGRQCQSIAKTPRAERRRKIPRVGVGVGGKSSWSSDWSSEGEGVGSSMRAMSAMSEDESVGTTRVPRPTSLFASAPKKKKI